MRREVDRLCDIILPGQVCKQSLDFEAAEMAMRFSVHKVGALFLEKLVNADRGGHCGAQIDCGSGHTAKFVGYRSKTVTTVLGDIKVQRAYYHSENLCKGYVPKDTQLDIEKTGFSPGVRRMMALVGAKESFDAGRDDLKILAGVSVTDKDVERISENIGESIEVISEQERREAVISNVSQLLPAIEDLYIMMDGTGVPMVKKETKGRKGKDESCEAKTREAKLGCLFTVTEMDKEGRPIRDKDTAVYTGQIETSEDFGERIYAQALRSGLARAKRVCVLGDGAAWIRNIVEDKFSKAIQIVDYYHATEHLGDLAKVVHAKNKPIRDLWLDTQCKELWEGDVAIVIEAMRRLEPDNETAKELLRTTVQYFETNEQRMQYAKFRAIGLFVGSGVIEAGCRTVVGQRLKLSGMRWTVRGANAIISLRCCQLSGQWEDYWANRAAA